MRHNGRLKRSGGCLPDSIAPWVSVTRVIDPGGLQRLIDLLIYSISIGGCVRKSVVIFAIFYSSLQPKSDRLLRRIEQRPGPNTVAKCRLNLLGGARRPQDTVHRASSLRVCGMKTKVKKKGISQADQFIRLTQSDLNVIMVTPFHTCLVPKRIYLHKFAI